MRTKLFLDSNVILDLALDRSEFIKNAESLFELEAIFFKQVLASEFLDFEDGLQYFSAVKVKSIEAIITRNTKDFKPSLIPVLTPAQFLRTIEP